MSTHLQMSRRRFLASAGGAAAFAFAPRHAAAQGRPRPPGERLNVAGIGVGGQGAGDIDAVAGHGHNIVALCDVDLKRGGRTLAKYSKARRFRDFRKMFDEMEKEIDAVVVATPDHTHAVAAMAAIRRGKHVYCEKPLAHSVGEVREMMKAARQYRVVTQLGNQGHSSESIRVFCEWIRDGAIGRVNRIDCGCRSVNSALDDLPRLKEQHPVPDTLDWDLWLGPARERPYHPAYLPGAWRHWVPFGNGTVGDWLCHVVDPVFWALDLGLPTSVRAEVKGWDARTQDDAFPRGEVITYEFPPKPGRGPITMKWYTGTEKIPRPPDLPADQDDIGIGAAVYGEKGVITYGSHGAGGVRIIPEAKMKAYKRPDKTIPRVPGGSHQGDWLQAIAQGKKAGCDFADYGGPLTEIAMLGVIAIKLNGTRLAYDGANMRFTNSSEANALIAPACRPPWTL